MIRSPRCQAADAEEVILSEFVAAASGVKCKHDSQGKQTVFFHREMLSMDQFPAKVKRYNF